MARERRDVLQWQVLEEQHVPLEALEWEEPALPARPARVVSDRRGRSFGRQLGAIAVVVLAIGAGLLWWRARLNETTIRREVQQALSHEALAWQAGDPDQFAATLDPNAERGWRSREQRRFEWLQLWAPQLTVTQGGSVESVALLGDRAEAELVYQRPDDETAYRTTAFFRRLSPEEGWRRTSPNPDLWGEAQEASTRHFHFVYRERDAEAVEAVLDDVEQFYSRLQRDLGTVEVGSDADGWRESISTGRITVTIVPRTDVVSWRLVDGAITLPSPLLQLVPADSTPDVELRRLLAQPLAHALIAAQAWSPRPLAMDGRAFTHAVGDWEAEDWSGAASSSVETQAAILRAARAQGEPLGVVAPLVWTHETYDRLWHAHAYFLADYVAEEYGRAAFAPLLSAWQTSSSWSGALKAALGVEMHDFEAGWERYLRRFDPAGRRTSDDDPALGSVAPAGSH